MLLKFLFFLNKLNKWKAEVKLESLSYKNVGVFFFFRLNKIHECYVNLKDEILITF